MSTSLQSYMTRHGLSDEAMASKIGDCTASAVRKWKYGERIPRPKTMARIHHVTKGDVSFGSWYAGSQIKRAG